MREERGGGGRGRDKDKKDGKGGGRAAAWILPPPPRVQVLRGEDRLRQLQGRAAAGAVPARARQDSAAADFGHVRAAPAQAAGRDQARPPAGADSVRHRLGRNHGSHSQRTRRQSRAPRRHREGRRGYARNYLLPRKLALAVTEGNKRQIERERKNAEARELEEKSQAEAFAARLAADRDRDRAPRRRERHALRIGHHRPTSPRRWRRRASRSIERKITLADPLKALGEYTVPVKIHRDVTAQVKVSVVAEK